MAQYFDDIFHRHINVQTPRASATPRVRRSSNARSITARSDFDDSVDGDTEASQSAVIEDPERERERSEADEHMHHYISDRLERFKENQLPADLERGEEFEAKAWE